MKKEFSPMAFLGAIGAGGIAVAPFAFFQYVVYNGKGLVKYASLHSGDLAIQTKIFYGILESIMLGFASLHILLSILLFSRFVRWVKRGHHDILVQDPIQNSALLLPFVSLFMTMNVFIGVIRYFVPSLADNLQLFMGPALGAWMVLLIVLLLYQVRLMRKSFVTSFDISKIHFGFLMQPFALAMATVTGAGIAALSNNLTIAHTAAFFSIVSGTLSLFLLVLKTGLIFFNHYKSNGLPEKQNMPAILSVIPVLTLLAISGFRIGHYLEHAFGMHMQSFIFFVVVGSFAVQTWYFLFGLSIVKDYLRKDFVKNEFYFSQWGLVCPFVAYGVLGSFMYNVFVPNPILLVVILGTLMIAIGIHLIILKRHTEKCFMGTSSVAPVKAAA
ncbi:MAG: hypothetical protein GX639_04220 [Fibrobacter sp.]|nr:hypothetical protein [Fibrobacter sp.]